MPDSGAGLGNATLWAAIAIGLVAAIVAFFWYKGRKMPGPHVFRASRLSRGNRLFPTQVAITKDSVIQYKPQWIGHSEEVIHIVHVASVKTVYLRLQLAPSIGPHEHSEHVRLSLMSL